MNHEGPLRAEYMRSQGTHICAIPKFRMTATTSVAPPNVPLATSKIATGNFASIVAIWSGYNLLSFFAANVSPKAGTSRLCRY